MSKKEHDSLNSIVSPYFHNFKLKFARLLAITIVDADVNANSNDLVSISPPTLGSEQQQKLLPYNDNYLYVPALTDSEKRELKDLIARITDDVINGNNKAEAKEVYNS